MVPLRGASLGATGEVGSVVTDDIPSLGVAEPAFGQTDYYPTGYYTYLWIGISPRSVCPVSQSASKLARRRGRLAPTSLCLLLTSKTDYMPTRDVPRRLKSHNVCPFRGRHHQHEGDRLEAPRRPRSDRSLCRCEALRVRGEVDTPTGGTAGRGVRALSSQFR